MAQALKRLAIPFHVAAGSDLPLVKDQFLTRLHEFGYRGKFSSFLCNGANRYLCTYGDSLTIDLVRKFDFLEYLGDREHDLLVSTIRRVLEREEFRLPSPMKVIGERIVFRQSMINVAPIGRPRGPIVKEAESNRKAFVEYDKKTGFRLKMLESFHRALTELHEKKGLDVCLGGETSFDFNIKGNDKSYALRALLAEGYENLVYFGDALHEGGNDEAILRFIESWSPQGKCPVQAQKVDGWKHTLSLLRELGFVSNGACAEDTFR